MKLPVLTLAFLLGFHICAFPQAQSGDNSQKAAEFNGDDLYAIGYALKEITPFTPANTDMAVRALRAASTRGSGSADVILGEMYLGGRIPPESGMTPLQEAIQHWNISWEKGAATGYFDLGLLYYNIVIPGASEGMPRGSALRLVPQDYGKALTYFKAACERGNGKACRWTGVSYEHGTGTAPDNAKAVEYYLRGADNRDSTSSYLLAGMLLTGKGITQDIPRAIAIYQAKMDKKGDVDTGKSAYALGQIYENGIYVQKDEDRAIACYAYAMAHGEAAAKPVVEAYAARLYQNGYALLQAGKYEAALPLIVKAADLGNGDALKLVGKV